MRMLKRLTAAVLMGTALLLPGAEPVLNGTFQAPRGDGETTVAEGENWKLLLDKGKLRLRGNGLDIDCFLQRLDDGGERSYRIVSGGGRVTVESGTFAYSAFGSIPLAGVRPAIGTAVLLEEPANSRPPPEWELVWADEFDRNGTPSPEKWSAEKEFIRNRELQFYTDLPENLRVEDGMLVMEARKVEPRDNPRFDAASDKWPRNQKTYSLTSASICSKAPYTMKADERLEVRAKIPTGPGFWPAIWATGENRNKIGWPKCGEIDFFEYFGNQPEMFSCNLHFSGAEGKHDADIGKAGLGFDPGTEFHVYAAEWDRNEFRSYIDGALIMRRPMPDETRNPARSYLQPFNLRFNFAVKSNQSTGLLPDDALPRKFMIDYVRVYRNRKQTNVNRE